MSVTKKVNCQNEYDALQCVITCHPHYMTMSEPIHQNHSHPNQPPINLPLASQQHKTFVEVLKKHGVHVIYLPVIKSFPNQVFTRDIGFVLDNVFFLTEMKSKSRIREELPLKAWLASQNISYHHIADSHIEGGDVLIDGETVFMGISSRTKRHALERLQEVLPQHTIIPLPFSDNYLHLDCVLNILSPEHAVIYKGVMSKEDMKILSSRYEFIEVPEQEQVNLAANILSIGNKKVISMPQNSIVNEAMVKHGYDVIEVEFSEMVKAGGSFRCATLPILRGGENSLFLKNHKQLV